MTKKLFWGIFPLLNACTIDLEVQLDVGLKDAEETVDKLNELVGEDGSIVFDEEDDVSIQEGDRLNGFEDETHHIDNDLEIDEGDSPDLQFESGDSVDEDPSLICEILLSHRQTFLEGEDIIVEWEMFGGTGADTVVALFKDHEAIHIDFLPPEQQDYFLPAPIEHGEYSVYVASGTDLESPDCFTMRDLVIVGEELLLEDEETVEPDGSQPLDGLCSLLESEHSLGVVHIGGNLMLEWDVSIFDEQVQVKMNKTSEPDLLVFVDFTENNGQFDLFLSEDIEAGEYQVSISSPDQRKCIHFTMMVQHNF